jgi:MFS family permease
LGWRSIFLATIPLSLFVIFVALRLRGEWAEAKEEKMDYVGSLIYCLTLIAIMYGFSQLPTVQGAGLMVVGILGLLTFVKWEMKVKNPVLDMDLFSHNRVFAFSNLAALLSYSSTFAITFLLSLYLQYIKGLSPQNAGLVLVCQPLMQAIFSPFAGRLSDRIEPGTVASLGMGITVMGLFLFIFLNEKTTLGYIIANLSLLGFGFALFSSPNMNAIMSSAERRSYGVASGTLATMRMTGQMFSMGISMLIFAIYLGGVQITAQYYPLFLKSTRAAFTVFASLCFLGIFASLARGKMR